MNSQLLVLFVFLACYFEVSLADSIDCPAAFRDKKVELRVQYDREDVAVYKYNKTNLVNVLIPFVNVTYTSEENSPPLLNTTFEGLAALTDEDTFEECDFVLKTSTKYSGDFSFATQRDLFTTAKSCLESQLCDQLREITRDDVLRADLEKYDFGENTVMINLINLRYPNIRLEKKRTTRSRGLGFGDSDLQSTLNAFVDFLMVGAVSYLSSSDLGKIKIPDQHKNLGAVFPAKEGHFIMSGGSFGDLTQIRRTEPVLLSNDGLRYTISVGLQLPNVKILFNNYDIKYSVLSKSGKASINITSITAAAKIIVNYNTFPCNISAGYIRSRIEGPSFQLSGGNWLVESVVNGVVNTAMDHFIHNIVDVLMTKLRAIAAVGLGKLDCEKFRPRLD